MCGLLMVKMQAARASISILKICAGEFPESTDFFTLKNNKALRNFKIITKKIEKFFKTQNHNFSRNYRDLNSIKNEFYGLIDEFDNHMRLLNFSMPININQLSAKNKESAKNIDLVNKDTDEMKEYLRSIVESANKEQINKIEEIKLNDSELLQKISTHIQNVEDFMRIKDAFDDPKKQDLIRKEITMNANLSPDNFIIEEAPIRGKVRKWHYKPFGKDVALKELLESQKNQPNKLELQIGILKTINESRDIIQYFGLVTINSKQFLVTEWAEYGTLREYYEEKNPNITIRARLALEIARGLNYLEEYEIFHHDVRSANVLVDCFEHAKITNFELSRNFSVAISKSIEISMENVRYMAPEKINDTTIRYNSKCEKLPFSESGLTVLAISQLILEGAMNLKFSSDVPKKWQKLVLKATQHKAKDRPEMKEVLGKIRRINDSINTTIPDASESYNDLPMLSFEKAIEQTKLKNGSKKRAWDTIAKYSERDNDFTAKYWKGHYLYHKMINFPYSDNERMQLAAEAFKEAADGANLQDAQYMYASCIYKKDPYKAIEYFEKAADQNHTVAMHNLGLLYYLGKYIDADKEKGEYWFKRAVDGNLDASIDFCKKNGITF
ncbi:kinase-like domain-containing protein [Gigaspora rosea]|uniref:Kinase-like domain-containing protein n=1 Tax=Gigaspora rosea TaxID=44941 RepID=A0A397W8Z2_9GLOM|nr:kinase-like domain-containing protein [Gigaspora rosea]